MNIYLLDNIEQFKKLKEGDRILVRWSDYTVKHNKNMKDVMLYEVSKILNNEIICQCKYNHYFNYEMYLKGNSGALEVYKIVV